MVAAENIIGKVSTLGLESYVYLLACVGCHNESLAKRTAPWRYRRWGDQRVGGNGKAEINAKESILSLSNLLIMLMDIQTDAS